MKSLGLEFECQFSHLVNLFSLLTSLSIPYGAAGGESEAIYAQCRALFAMINVQWILLIIISPKWILNACGPGLYLPFLLFPPQYLAS